MILSIGQHPVKFIKEGKEDELVERLAEGIEKVAAAFYPSRYGTEPSTLQPTSSERCLEERTNQKRGTQCSDGEELGEVSINQSY